MYKKKKYQDEDFMYALPFNINGKGIRIKSILEPTYEYFYGDEIHLCFGIVEAFRKYPSTITIYDSNFIPMCCSENNMVDENNKIYMNFSAEESKQLFPKGTYYCGIQSSTLHTLQSPNQCMIRIV